MEYITNFSSKVKSVDLKTENNFLSINKIASVLDRMLEN